MAEEAKDEAKTIPAAINRVVIAVFAIYALLPMVALSALPVTQHADGYYTTLLGVPEDKGGYAGDPILGVVKQLDLGPFQHAGEIYVGLLAATILFIATNAGIIGVSRLVYSMGLHRQLPDRLRQLHPKLRHAVDRDPAVRRDRVRGDDPGPGRLPGQHVRVRRDAVVHDRAPLGHPPAQALSGLRAPLPRAGQHARRAATSCRCSRVLGGIGTGLAFVVVTALHIDVALAGIGWLALGCVIYPIYRHRQGLDLTTTVKVAIPAPVVDHEAEYESILVALEGKHYSEGAMATADQGRGAPAARHPRAGHDHRAGLGADQRLAARTGARRPGDHRAGQAPGRPARDRPLGEGPRRRRRPAHRRRGARRCGRRRSCCRCRRRGGSTVFGKTVETVLAERPCRVIIQADPAVRSARRRRPRRRSGVASDRAQPTRRPPRRHPGHVRGDGAHRHRAARLDARARRRARSRSACCSACSSSPRASAGCTSATRG